MPGRSQELTKCPKTLYYIDKEEENAMTKKEKEDLRDKAALAALTGLLASGNFIDYEYWQITEVAYEYADATLAARELPGNYEYMRTQLEKKKH
jgi:hypothetical protein